MSRRADRLYTRRWAALAALTGLVAAGLIAHLALPETSGSDIAGDALYAAAVYAAIAVVAPGLRSAGVAALAAGWCVAVELFQLTGIPMLLGAAFAPAVLVLGTVFDPRDLVVYPLAIVGAWAIDAAVRTPARSTRHR